MQLKKFDKLTQVYRDQDLSRVFLLVQVILDSWETVEYELYSSWKCDKRKDWSDMFDGKNDW